jgi:tRNA pseudouridine13 synthase
MKLKQRPEDFSVIESYRYNEAPRGKYFVYRMDKQKLTTLGAVERLRERFRIKRQDFSFCGLKDKQGRTEQLIAVHDRRVDIQDPDLKLTFLGRSDEPLSARNITSNRFSVIVRDLSAEEVERLPEALAEVQRVGVVNYFDSQRFGFVKHGQGFIARDLLRGDLQAALKSLIAHPSELDRSEDARVKAFFRDHWGEWNMTPPQAGWLKYRPIIQHLRENPHDFGGALMKVDQRLRMMVVFEFQSAIWNESVRQFLHGLVPHKELVSLRYQLGALDFPRALPQRVFEALRDGSFPLLGPDSTFSHPDIEKASTTVLGRYGLTLDKLKSEKLNAFHFKHEERPLLVFPGKLHASEGRPDEENQGRLKVVLSFTLPPGAYATLVVRRVLWYATNEHQPEVPRYAQRPAPVRAAPAEPPVPRPKPKGFRERQQEAKSARTAARAAQPAPRKPRGR